MDEEGLPLAEGDGEAEGLKEGDGDIPVEGLADDEGDPEGEVDADGLAVGLGLADGEIDADGLTLDDGERLVSNKPSSVNACPALMESATFLISRFLANLNAPGIPRSSKSEIPPLNFSISYTITQDYRLEVSEGKFINSNFCICLYKYYPHQNIFQYIRPEKVMDLLKLMVKDLENGMGTMTATKKLKARDSKKQKWMVITMETHLVLQIQKPTPKEMRIMINSNSATKKLKPKVKVMAKETPTN